MTKKSAAQFKVADKAKSLPAIEDVFANQKQGLLATLDVQLKQDDRFDTLLSIRESYHRFHFDATEADIDLTEVKALAAKVKDIHQKLRDMVEQLTLEGLTAETYANPCDELVAFEEPADWAGVFEQTVLFSAVQPYGQSFDDLRNRMVEEVAKRV